MALQASTNSIAASELSIANVRLGDSEKTTVRKLGKPLNRTNNGEGFVLSYQELAVAHGVEPYGVYEMESTNPKYCTPKKVCPGISIEKLKRIYGEPIVAERDEGKFLEYIGNKTTCWLQISVFNDFVKSIRVACQP
jgi:hypothetical protein